MKSTLIKMKTKPISKNSTGTCRINWEEGLAYSYDTIVGTRITARDGQYIWLLTGIPYSVTTSKHLFNIALTVSYHSIYLPDEVGLDASKEQMREWVTTTTKNMSRSRVRVPERCAAIWALALRYIQAGLLDYEDVPTSLYRPSHGGDAFISLHGIKNKQLVELTPEQTELYRAAHG